MIKNYIFLLTFFSLVGFAKLPEKHYQDIFAAKVGGQTEVTAGDGTRCDILTPTHAIEVDFARKWGEAIGQSLNYGFQFNRKAGILLILESPSDRKHLIRIKSIVRYYNLPIDVWETEPNQQSNYAPPASSLKNTATSRGDYWISSTGKTHKKGCRYYAKGNGRNAKKGSGNNCKICGGAN